MTKKEKELFRLIMGREPLPGETLRIIERDDPPRKENAGGKPASSINLVETG